MIYLILAILSSAFVSVFMRLSEEHRKNHISMLCVNYLICLVLAGSYSGWMTLFPSGPDISAADARTSLLLGTFQGIMYLGSFLLLQWNISKNGVILSATFMKLGVLVPTLCAILFLHEKPGMLQIIGMILAVAAILLMNLEKGQKKAGFFAGLILLLFGGGITDVCAKIYEVIGDPLLKDQFLFYTFAVALILCILFAVWKKQRLCSADVLFGALIGIPNYYSARFLLYALQDVPAVVAYPTYSVATIAAISMTGIFLFREHLSRKQYLAVGIILAALILLNC